MIDLRIKPACKTGISKWLLQLLLIIVFILSVNPFIQATEKNQITGGWIEHAVLFPANVQLKAKLDTGAKTSSINAADIKYFTRRGKQWIRFNLTTFKNKSVTIEQPVYRSATIKRHFGKYQQRPVIKLDICIGGIRKNLGVTLVDRSGLNYQLLIGRNFLARDILVDSGQTFQLDPVLCATTKQTSKE